MSATLTQNRTRNLRAGVPIAWPTLALTLACLVVWGGAIALCAAGHLPIGIACALSTIAAFASFTPMHDAVHRSVGRSRTLNAVIGRLAGLPLIAPFPAVRHAHLTHHRHTNEDGVDPDFWSARGPALLLPLRWLTQDLYYYAWYARAGRQRPARERVETWLTAAAFYGLAAGLALQGHGVAVLLLWLIPSRLATGLLAFTFDYLPHHPHHVSASEDPYRATSVLTELWLTPLFLYQNFHLIHHLYPGVPFYRYAQIWRAEREALLSRGAREVRFLFP